MHIKPYLGEGDGRGKSGFVVNRGAIIGVCGKSGRGKSGFVVYQSYHCVLCRLKCYDLLF